MKRVSAAQAKLVAGIWACHPALMQALIANGEPFEYYRVSQAGFALADFLRSDK